MKTALLFLVITVMAAFVMDRGLTQLAGCASEKECAGVAAPAHVHSNSN